MNSRDVAFGRKGDGREYYQLCGAEAGIPGLSRIFQMFCEDEARHAHALRALQEGARVDLDGSPTLDRARPILRALSVQEAALVHFNGDLARYGSAMDFDAARLAREAVHG